MPRCSVCLQVRTSLKFQTGRLSICRYCVTSLNTTSLSPQDAREKWLAGFRAGIVHNQPEAVSWVDRWLETSGSWILAQRLEDETRVQGSHELKILRAHNGGLVCLNQRYLNYPENWDYKRYRTKHLDSYACRNAERKNRRVRYFTRTTLYFVVGAEQTVTAIS